MEILKIQREVLVAGFCHHWVAVSCVYAKLSYWHQLHIIHTDLRLREVNVFLLMMDYLFKATKD